jgi:hypothetical protein
LTRYGKYKVLSKIFIVFAILAIVYALGSSFYFLIRDKGEGKRTVRRLTWRVGLSLMLFILIYAAMASGWLIPGSSGPIRYPSPAADELTDP